MVVPTAQDVLEREQALDPSVWEALAPRERESKAAHAAFLDYVRMRPRRSIRYLYAGYVKRPPTGSRSPNRLNTLFAWSTRHGWQDLGKLVVVGNEWIEPSRWPVQQRFDF